MGNEMNLGEQKKAEDFKQHLGQIVGVKHNPEFVAIVIGHQETETLQPMKMVTILDTEILLTPGAAMGLKNQLEYHLKELGVKEQKGKGKGKGGDPPGYQ